ncbi:hypothetical protein K7G98_43760, partial [Saccharothrix sp. MB29]|nr:hypothetical protein [Saccharothrix sp. MB29]
RNKIAHGVDLDEVEATILDSSIAELVDYLRLMESSSLGSSQAQTNRLLSTPAEIDDVLRRSPLPFSPPQTTPGTPV